MHTLKWIALVVLAGLWAAATAEPPLRVSAGGLAFRELQPGAGNPTVPGDIAKIHLVMWLDQQGERGKELYNSRSERAPIAFVVGSENIMPALNEGVVGMKPGGKRMLVVPPAFAYGTRGLPEVADAQTSFFVLVDLIDNQPP